MSKSVDLNFKVSPEFKRKFRLWAATHDITQKKALEDAFQALMDRAEKAEQDADTVYESEPAQEPRTEIVFGKLARKVFTSAEKNYHVYKLRRFGGDWFNAVYRGKDAPKALKSIEYQLSGFWGHHKEYGKQFEIKNFHRSDVAGRTESAEDSILRSAQKFIGGASA